MNNQGWTDGSVAKRICYSFRRPRFGSRRSGALFWLPHIWGKNVVHIQIKAKYRWGKTHIKVKINKPQKKMNSNDNVYCSYMQEPFLKQIYQDNLHIYVRKLHSVANFCIFWGGTSCPLLYHLSKISIQSTAMKIKILSPSIGQDCFQSFVYLTTYPSRTKQAPYERSRFPKGKT